MAQPREGVAEDAVSAPHIWRGSCGEEKHLGLRDIPWERQRLKVVFTLYPLNCFEEGAEGALALKINIEPHRLMYDWVKIARAILSSWSEQYVRWLRERFGPVDAVKIVGPGA